MNRKGVTPIVATVLLLTISVAATASAYTFIRETQQSSIDSFEDRLNKKQLKQKSDLNIEFVYNSTEGDFTLMNLRNTGSVTLNLVDEGQKVLSLYSNGRPISSEAGSNGKGWRFTDDGLAAKSTVRLDPGQTVELNSTVKFPEKGKDSVFKLVGPYGISDSYVCVNSGTASC